MGVTSTSVDVAIALETEKHRIAVNDSAVFKLIYGNKSNTRATNVKLSVTIPQEFTILQAPGGRPKWQYHYLDHRGATG
ncbi:MAG: hypothetical protein RQM92_11995 [Candidatus Syntrophopropionicum ammoniitolerans]